MIIQCESCKRKFRLDDSRIEPPGNNVKCSKCGNIFYVAKKGNPPENDLLEISDDPAVLEEKREEKNQVEDSFGTVLNDTHTTGISDDSIQNDTRFEETNEKTDEPDEDIVDIPTEQQVDLEDYIDNKAYNVEQDNLEVEETSVLEHNVATGLEEDDASVLEQEESTELEQDEPSALGQEVSSELELKETSVFKNHEPSESEQDRQDAEEIEDVDISLEDPEGFLEDSPDLFDTESSDNQSFDNEEMDTEDELIEKSFEEHEEESAEELFDQDIEIDSLEQQIPGSEEVDNQDIDGPRKYISDNLSNRKIMKSNTGIVTKFIYTIITIAAIFVIFLASLVMLINAEILPKGTLSGLTSLVEFVIPIESGDNENPQIIISEHKARWMNTVNGPVYIVSGLITNESETPIHYVKMKSEYMAAEKKQYEDVFYAGNTFTDRELKASPIQNILSKLDQKNGDIDVNNSRKLAGLNYNIQPGESIPFYTVFPADGRVLGLKYNLEVIDFKEAPSN